MPACATKQTLPEIVSVRNLFLPVPDTDFRDFLHEIENLAKFAPEIIGAIEFDLDAHARRNRSAVESLMFTIKDGFEFGELGRRGIAAVRDELLEKVLAYNCCRIILIKQKREERSKKAA